MALFREGRSHLPGSSHGGTQRMSEMVEGVIALVDLGLIIAFIILSLILIFGTIYVGSLIIVFDAEEWKQWRSRRVR